MEQPGQDQELPAFLHAIEEVEVSREAQILAGQHNILEAEEALHLLRLRHAEELYEAEGRVRRDEAYLIALKEQHSAEIRDAEEAIKTVNQELRITLGQEIEDAPDHQMSDEDIEPPSSPEEQMHATPIQEVHAAKKVGHGIPLRSQTQQVLANVIKFMEKEKKFGVINLDNVQERASEATGVSMSSICRVIMTKRKNDESGLPTTYVTPGKKRKKTHSKVNIDGFDQDAVRRILYSYHLQEGELPTAKRRVAKISDLLGYAVSESTVSRIIHKLGFRWRQTKDNRHVLMERSDIRGRRAEYLQKLRKYRKEGRSIYYTDETYIDANHSKKSAWSDNTDRGFRKLIGKGGRVIIVHAGNEGGFVPNALLMFKSGQKSGDYHDSMNYENYERWLKEKLLPNIPENSVIVIDNASYHNSQSERLPTTAWRKGEMQAWLREKGIPYDESLTKPKLYDIIKLHKEKYMKFRIDDLVKSPAFQAKNVVFLRLPPYHPNLNPIEKIWALVKGDVAQKNVSSDWNAVIELAKAKFESVTVDEWKSRVENARKVENEYVRQDGIQEDLQPFIINLESDSSDSESDCDSPDEVECSDMEGFEDLSETEWDNPEELIEVVEVDTFDTEFSPLEDFIGEVVEIECTSGHVSSMEE